MNLEKQISEEIKIPVDVIIEVLAIVVKAKIKHGLLQVMENRSLVVMELVYETDDKTRAAAVQNIKDIISYYNEYRYDEIENSDWRDN